MATTYCVVVLYEGYDPKFDAKLRKAAKRDSGGSGYGFGTRDIAFYTATKAGAAAVAKRLRAVRGKLKKVTVAKIGDRDE